MFEFDTKQFDQLHKTLLDLGKKGFGERDMDVIMRRSLKVVKERVGQLQPKSINNGRGSYSSAQKSIEKYGLLEKALGISKARKKGLVGDHSFFVGYDARRGKKAFVSVFMNYGFTAPNGRFIQGLAFAQRAERETDSSVRKAFLEEGQKMFDKRFVGL